MVEEKDDLFDDLDDLEFEVDESNDEISDSADDSEETNEKGEAQEEVESEEEEESDEGETSLESGYQDLSSEEKAKFGKRAQKRIGRLVAQTKGAEEQIAALRAENEKLRKDNAETTSSATRTRAWALEQADTRLDAYTEVASQRVRAAREDGDFDAEQEAQQALNQIAVEKGQLKQARLSLPDEEESAGVEDAESQHRQAPPPMSPAFKKWYSRNTWFGDGSSMKTKLMSEHSMEVHRQLEEQGIDPADDPELYYASIDKGMREQFPNDPLLPRTAAKTKSKSPVGGRTRSASGHSRPTFEKRGGKMKANLTDDQKRMAADMGVSQKDYAKQLYKIAKRDGTL